MTNEERLKVFGETFDEAKDRFEKMTLKELEEEAEILSNLILESKEKQIAALKRQIQIYESGKVER